MNNELLLIISNTLTALASFFIGKRKTNADTDNIILSNLEKSMMIYAELVKNLKTEIHELNLKVQDLEKKVDDLMVENRKLKWEKERKND
jgi:phage shock protein A